MADKDSWTSSLSDAKHFSSREEAEARLAEVGEVAWGCKVLRRCVGGVQLGDVMHPIVIVEVATIDGSGSRLFLYRDD